MRTHTINSTWSSNGQSVVARKVQNGEAEQNLDVAIPGSATAQLVAFALDVSQLKSFFLYSEKALTVKTNSSGSPINTFTLPAGIPFAWQTGDPALRDTAGTTVTTDITALYVVNADADPVTLQIRALYDPTL